MADIFRLLSDEARKTLLQARVRASESGRMSIEPEHILLALLDQPDAAAARALVAAGVSLDDLAKEAHRDLLTQQPPQLGSAEIPFSTRTKEVLTFAVEQGQQSDVGPEHLLLGVAQSTELLSRRGIEIPGLRRLLGFS